MLPVRCSVFLCRPLYLTHIEMAFLWHGACTVILPGVFALITLLSLGWLAKEYIVLKRAASRMQLIRREEISAKHTVFAERAPQFENQTRKPRD